MVVMQHRAEWCQMVPNGSKWWWWCKFVRNGFKNALNALKTGDAASCGMIQMVVVVRVSCGMVPNGSKW